MTDLGTRHTQSNPGLSRNRHTEKNRDRSVTLGLTFDNEDQDDRSWHTSYTIKPRPVKKQTHRDRSVTLGLTFDNEDQDDRSWHTSYTIKPRPVKKQTHREEQRQICDTGADLRQRGPG